MSHISLASKTFVRFMQQHLMQDQYSIDPALAHTAEAHSQAFFSEY